LFFELKNSFVHICKKVADRQLLKEILKILKLWTDRGVYKKDVLVPVIRQYETIISDLKNENRELTPEINFSIEDIANYVTGKKILEKWTSKTEESKFEVDAMIPKTDDTTIGD